MRDAIQIMKTKSVSMKKLTADLLLQTDNAKLEKEKELDALVADVKKVGDIFQNDCQLVPNIGS